PPPRMRRAAEPSDTGAGDNTTGVAAPLMLAAAVAAIALGSPAPAHAQNASSIVPSTELLDQLKQRLIAAPRCAPECAALAEARVVVDGERLEIIMRVSALASLAVAMPHASDRWHLDDVSVDEHASLAIAREGDASLWLPLTPGSHSVRLAGRL